MATIRPCRFLRGAQRGRQGYGLMSAMTVPSRAARLLPHSSTSHPTVRTPIQIGISRGGMALFKPMPMVATTTFIVPTVAPLRSRYRKPEGVSRQYLGRRCPAVPCRRAMRSGRDRTHDGKRAQMISLAAFAGWIRQIGEGAVSALQFARSGNAKIPVEGLMSVVLEVFGCGGRI